MALFACLDCGNQISRRANACPHCGFDVRGALAEAREMKQQPLIGIRELWVTARPTILPLLGLLLVLGIGLGAIDFILNGINYAFEHAAADAYSWEVEKARAALAAFIITRFLLGVAHLAYLGCGVLLSIWILDRKPLGKFPWHMPLLSVYKLAFFIALLALPSGVVYALYTIDSRVGVVGGLLLFVPSFVFNLRAAFVPHLMLDKGMDPIRALKRSFRLTAGHEWTVHLASLGMFGILVLSTYATIATGFGFFITSLAGVVLAPIALSILAVFYRRLVPGIQKGPQTAPLQVEEAVL